MHNGNFYRHGGGVELNLSSSRKYALTLGQFKLKQGRGILLAPKNHYSLGIGLSLYKSIRRNVRLYASAKVRDTQYCKLGAKVLKSFCAPLAPKFTYKKRSGGKLGYGVMDSSRTHKQLCINK